MNVNIGELCPVLCQISIITSALVLAEFGQNLLQLFHLNDVLHD
jgi:hypothetical protein